MSQLLKAEKPTVSACRVPYAVFTEKSYYDREQEKIFRGDEWSFVGLEAEIPNHGDYKTTFIGDTPVIVIRDQDGAVNVLQNRCVHRGALICRNLRGNSQSLECIYHQWSYDLQGKLTGVPFRRGIQGKGGMPADFNLKDHGLPRLRVEIINGLVFASYSKKVEPLRDYLGPMVVESIERIFCRPIEVLGDQRQYVHANWKLYAENVRDPYHASLLHLFHTTFGLYRSSQAGGIRTDAANRHSMLYSIKGSTNEALDKEVYKDMRTFDAGFALQDPSLLAGRPDYSDPISLVILTVFPNLVVQQIANTLAVRQIVTYGPNAFELVWTHFGYADDDAEMKKMRLKQANLIGPAGVISMEDGEAVEIVQRAVSGEQDQSSYIAMGGSQAGGADHLVTESSIIGFWEYYQKKVGISPTWKTGE